MKNSMPRAFITRRLVFLMLCLLASGAVHADSNLDTIDNQWWVWPLALLIVSFLIGVVGVLGGVGGGVLFVPIVSGFFPFHLDFVRGAGLLIALAGALAASPKLLKTSLADIRLVMPMAFIASISSIFGAIIGLAMPANIVQICLGIAILLIVYLMYKSKESEFPRVPSSDYLSNSLKIYGIYHDPAIKKDVSWRIHRTVPGLFLFVGIGFLAGLFGLGAGWANVPVLNLVLGAPLKLSVASSKFLLSIVDTSAVWVYINQGAVLAIIAVPSVIGVMLGSLIGVRLLANIQSKYIRIIIIVLLFFAGLRALLKGLGIWN
jgi:uncharacterized membrane protein YfcA